MKTRLDYEKKLRAVERDIMWNKQVFADSRDPKQKDRVAGRLRNLEAARASLQLTIREWGKTA